MSLDEHEHAVTIIVSEEQDQFHGKQGHLEPLQYKPEWGRSRDEKRWKKRATGFGEHHLSAALRFGTEPSMTMHFCTHEYCFIFDGTEGSCLSF